MITVRMEYIYYRKKAINKEIPFTEISNDSFFDLTSNSFTIIVKDKSHRLTYKENNNNDILFLSLQYTNSQVRAIRIMESVVKQLNTIECKKEYNISPIYDGISEYYCNKLYPKWNKFERQLREFFNSILAKAYNKDWYKLKPDGKESIKETFKLNHTKALEKGLYFFTFSQLTTYVFTPYRTFEEQQDFESVYNSDNLKEKTKADIIKYIENSKPKSLWKRLFSDYDFPTLEEDLANLKEYRNIIAHTKLIDENGYKKCVSILSRYNKKFESVINGETKIEEDICKILPSSTLLASFKVLNSKMASFADSPSIKALSGALASYADSPLIKALNSTPSFADSPLIKALNSPIAPKGLMNRTIEERDGINSTENKTTHLDTNAYNQDDLEVLNNKDDEIDD